MKRKHKLYIIEVTTGMGEHITKYAYKTKAEVDIFLEGMQAGSDGNSSAEVSHGYTDDEDLI